MHSRIKQIWHNYGSDLGLARICLLIIAYNCLFFISTVLFFSRPQLWTLGPALLAGAGLLLRSRIIRWGQKGLIIVAIIIIFATVIPNYFITGEIDRAAGGLPRNDQFFASFDHAVWGMQVATFIETKTQNLMGENSRLVYDFLMVVYFLYFVFPVYGAICYFTSLQGKQMWKMSRYCFSFLFSFMLNNILYLTVPVTGPQYFISEQFPRPLPFSAFGETLHGYISLGQKNYIDCFPSGHVWITALVAIWLFSIKHSHRYVALAIAVLMGAATLALRYHYSLDIVASIPAAFLAFHVARKVFREPPSGLTT